MAACPRASGAPGGITTASSAYSETAALALPALNSFTHVSVPARIVAASSATAANGANAIRRTRAVAKSAIGFKVFIRILAEFDGISNGDARRRFYIERTF